MTIAASPRAPRPLWRQGLLIVRCLVASMLLPACECAPLVGPPPPSTLTATMGATPARAEADGRTSIVLTLQVRDAANAGVVAGLRWTTTIGALEDAPTRTGPDGNAEVVLRSTTAGDGVVVVSVSTEGGGPAQDVAADVGFDPCLSVTQRLDQQVFPAVLSRCQGCHNEFGLAGAYDLDFSLPFRGASSTWAADTVAALQPLALLDTETTDGTGSAARLLAKPTGVAVEGHVGGVLFSPDSEEARLLRDLVERLRSPDGCQDAPDVALAALDDLTLLGPRETWARARAAMLAESTTPEDLEAMPDNEDELAARLDVLLADPRMDARIVELFNDWLLTDAAHSQTGAGAGLASRNREFVRRDFFAPPGSGSFQRCDEATEDCCLEFFDAAFCCPASEGDTCSGRIREVADLLAREPLEVIARLAREDRPMSEAFTVAEALMSPLTAVHYGLDDAQRAALFDDDPGNDATERAWATVRVSPLATLPADWPHAGLLTTPSTLSRWSTTRSNKNRGRAASLTFRRMLAIDVMRFAEFSTASLPADADLETATQNEIACTSCHAALDPVAQLWGNFQLAGALRVPVPAAQLENMPPPSFLGEPFDPAAAGGQLGVQWLAERAVQHERFPVALTWAVLGGLLGVREADVAVDRADPDFAAKTAARRVQDRLVTTISERFVSVHGLRLRGLLKEVLLSPFFRARDAHATDPLATAALARAGVGRGVVATPEHLARRIEQATGVRWMDGTTDMLLRFSAFRVLAGGANFTTIAARFREPTPTYARIVERMANEIACEAIPAELGNANPQSRRLLRDVEATTLLLDPGGNLIPADDVRARAALRRLFRVLLNVDARDGDVELEAAHEMLVAALREGRALRAQESIPATLSRQCRGAIVDDPEYVVRGWMAVASYLLSDPRFFLE